MDEKELIIEEKYLKKVQKIIKNYILISKNTCAELNNELDKYKKYYQENVRAFLINIDEKSDLETNLQNIHSMQSMMTRRNKRFLRQYKKPYFARLSVSNMTSSLGDWNDEKGFDAYIGMGEVLDDQGFPVVVDWRSDIATLYYDNDCGDAQYTTQFETVFCKLNQKRQYQFENGKLILYVDSDFNVNDEILQMELSKNASTKMKSIISTLQKEQNMIIRNNFARGLLVQGVAGSGKTSIALHKIAYMLYTFRDKLESKDILIMSPSDYFSNYISGVLPDLDEDNCKMTTFEHIFRSMSNERFIDRATYLEDLFEKGDPIKFEEIAIKSSFDFKDKVLTFISKKLPTYFKPKNIRIGKFQILASEIYTLFFEKLKDAKIYDRIDVMADLFCERLTKSKKLKDEIKEKFKNILYGMLSMDRPIKIYNDFLQSCNMPQVECLSYLDLPAYLLIKQNLLKTSFYYGAKYLIVDEIQDLSPLHFEFFEQNMDCQKLYLGDINQCIEKTLDSSYLQDMQKTYNLDIVQLTKTYRSTRQIFEMSLKIKDIKNANCVARDGEEVEIVKGGLEEIENYVKKYSAIFEHIAVLCKNESEASDILEKIKNPKCTSMIKDKKLLILAGYNAKGVEFDMVIIPNCDDTRYKSEIDRNLLYVSCTRALHKLCIIYSEKLTKLISL